MEQFRKYLDQWKLIAEGTAIETASSSLLWVRCADGTPAMLKLAHCEEECRGNALMAWWAGEGAARVIARDGAVLLMERLDGPRSLITMSQNGEDTEATQIICETAAKLHRPGRTPKPELVPLSIWFGELEAAAVEYGGVLCRSHRVSHRLLADPMDIVVLHGDLHHANVLDGGARGWLAIDPKALLGESGFDYANIFCNPDSTTATSPGRLAKQASVVARAGRLELSRLLQWILAYAGLSAAWSLHTDEDPRLALAVAEIAASHLSTNLGEK